MEWEITKRKENGDGARTTDAIVAIAEDLDAHAMVLMGQCIKTSEQFVEGSHLIWVRSTSFVWLIPDKPVLPRYNGRQGW
jgi:hypothetical protein